MCFRNYRVDSTRRTTLSQTTSTLVIDMVAASDNEQKNPLPQGHAAKTRVQKLIRAENTAKIAELYLQGMSLGDISTKLQISLSTISRYLTKAREEWLANAAETVELIIAKELARIDAVERAAWVGWNRSLRTSLSTSDGPHGVTTTRQKQNGDPRFLVVIQKCTEQRAKLLGLDRPTDESSTQLGVIEVIIESKAQLKSIVGYQEFKNSNPQVLNHSSTDGATEENEPNE